MLTVPLRHALRSFVIVQVVHTTGLFGGAKMHICEAQVSTLGVAMRACPNYIENCRHRSASQQHQEEKFKFHHQSKPRTHRVTGFKLPTKRCRMAHDRLAQHSTAQHSTAQHSIRRMTTSRDFAGSVIAAIHQQENSVEQFHHNKRKDTLAPQ
jgi:hypothetical protein